jgi:EpsD family peptidyl-prolyl cis-trans isomerase
MERIAGEMQMKRIFLVSVAAVALMSVSACHGQSGAALDKGQVVATVDGEEITVFELNAEMQAAPAPAGVDRKVLEQMALQRVIERKILAKIARDRGLEKNPAFLLQQRRASELILATMLRDQIASKIAQPNDSEIATYQTAHPEFFAQRKVFTVEQIIFPTPTNMAKFKEIAPLKTLDQLAAKLTADGTQFRRGPGKIDSLQLPPDAVKKMGALPAGEMFVLPSQQGVTANVITETTIVPLTGTDARNAAINALKAERFAKAADSQFADTVKKAKDSVKYQPGYAPPAAPKGAPTPGAAGALPSPAATPKP